MMKRNITALVLLLTLCVAGLAQEGLKPLNSNPNLIYNDLKPRAPEVKSNPALRTQATSLFIPFKEDFFYAPTQSYPDPGKWTDSAAFINTGYPIAPPSIGVATFDGLNLHGYPYDPAIVNNTISKPADKLTSQPINLKQTASSQTLQPSDSVAISFYYESTGYGETPELSDSLSLDFFAPSQNKWYNAVWFKTRSGTSNLAKGDTTFTRGFVWITDTSYLQDNFRFRFRNAATTTGNFDHWHVDYIYLDKNRSQRADTIYDDLTFAYMPTPLLRDYSAMPYEQYNANEMAPKNLVKIRNSSSAQMNMTYRYEIDTANTLLSTYTGNAFVLGPYRQIGYSPYGPHANPPINYTFAPMVDSVDYRITHFLKQSSSSSDFIPRNDTLVQHQRFRNYYALDDGSAESGYYVNAASAKMAIKINVNVADSFLAVRIYFDPVGQVINVQQNSLGFRIAAWAPGSNGPGTLLFRDTIFKPRYYNSDPAYAFAEYKLVRPKLLQPGTYYIGIQQFADVLTLGFDRNVDHSGSMYYDSGSGWTQSTLRGSVMIHPIFGRTLPHPVGLDELADAPGKLLLVYPNPAADRLTVNYSGKEPVNYSLLNAIGQQLGEGLISSESGTIDTGALPNGMYLLVFKSNNRAVQQQKIIIQH